MSETEGGQQIDIEALTQKITESVGGFVEKKIGESQAAYEERMRNIESRFETQKSDKPDNWDMMDDDDRAAYLRKESKSYTDERFSKVERETQVTKAILAAETVAKSLGFEGEVASYAIDNAKQRLISLAQQNPAIIEALSDPNNEATKQMRQDLIDVSLANAQRAHQKVVQDKSQGYHKDGDERQSLDEFKAYYKKNMGRDIDDERAKRLMAMGDE